LVQGKAFEFVRKELHEAGDGEGCENPIQEYLSRAARSAHKSAALALRQGALPAQYARDEEQGQSAAASYLSDDPGKPVMRGTIVQQRVGAWRARAGRNGRGMGRSPAEDDAIRDIVSKGHRQHGQIGLKKMS
jgi:hypothetical protein